MRKNYRIKYRLYKILKISHNEKINLSEVNVNKVKLKINTYLKKYN